MAAASPLRGPYLGFGVTALQNLVTPKHIQLPGDRPAAPAFSHAALAVCPASSAFCPMTLAFCPSVLAFCPAALAFCPTGCKQGEDSECAMPLVLPDAIASGTWNPVASKTTLVTGDFLALLLFCGEGGTGPASSSYALGSVCL